MGGRNKASNGRMPVSARIANKIGLMCPQGHHSEWTTSYRNDRKRASRECKQCGRDKATAVHYGISKSELAAFRAAHPVCDICGV